MSWWKRVWRRLWRRRIVMVHDPRWERERGDLFIRDFEELQLRFQVSRELLRDGRREALAEALAEDARRLAHRAVMDYGA